MNEPISAEELVGEEWANWYALSPLERLEESSKLWNYYLTMGGSLDCEPDTQSPFYFPDEKCSIPAYGGTSLRVIRRGGV